MRPGLSVLAAAALLAACASSGPKLVVPTLEVLQDPEKSKGTCGLAALGMVAHYYGKELDPESAAQLRKEGDKQGDLTLDQLKRAWERSGFFATFFTGRLDGVSQSGVWYHLQKGRPVIVRIVSEHAGHYVVLAGYDDERKLVRFADPASAGLPPRHRTLRLAAFKKAWQDAGSYVLLALPESPPQ